MRHLHFTLIAAGLLLASGIVRAQQTDVDVLSESLVNEGSQVRADAAKSLANLGPEAASAVPALTKALADTEANVRAYAALALGEIGKPAETAVEPLMDMLLDENTQVRRAAFRALRNIDPPREKTRPRLLKVLETGDPAIVTQILHLIAAEGKEVVPRLREALKDETSCYWACVILSDMGSEGAEAVPELISCLDSEQHEVRLNALIALGAIGMASEAAEAKAIEILQNEKIDGIRYAAVFLVGKIGKKGDDALNGILVDTAKGDEPMLKMLSLWALARLNPDHERLVRHAAENIGQNLKSEDSILRSTAARALAEFDAPPEIVAPELVQSLKDADPRVVGNALEALAALGPKVLPAVSRALSKKDRRHYAARIIFLMGPDGADAVPALIEALQAGGEEPDDLQFRREVLMTLAALGPRAKPAISTLVDALDTNDSELRGLAAFALGKMGPEAADAVPALRKRLRDGLGSGNPTPIVWALLNILPEDQPIKVMAVPLLRRALSHQEDFVRAEAAQALGRIGAPAQVAVDDLKPLLEDESPVVRDAAATAIEALKQ